MFNVLVSGANGFIGNVLCRRLVAEGWRVHGAVRSASNSAKLQEGINIIEVGAINSDTDWEPALSGINVVVHLAARVHVMAENAADAIADYRDTNVAGTKQLAQIAVSKGVRRFIYMSSIKVNGEGKAQPYTTHDRPGPVDSYGISKLEAEQELASIANKTGLEVVILRPPLVYGPGVKANFLQLIDLIKKGIPLPLASVRNQRSFIFVGNLADAIVTNIVHPQAAGKTYLLSDGVDVSTPELIQKLSSAIGRSSRLFQCPPDLLRLLGKITGKSMAVSKLLDSLTVDTSRILSELGWIPPYSMEAGMRETAKWYLQR